MTEATKPEAIKPLSEFITLPVRQDGSAPYVFHVRALSGAGLIAAQEAALVMVPANDRPPTAEELGDMDRAYRRVAQVGIIEPKLIFEGEGSPRWDDLTVPEQIAVIKAIYRLSGLGTSADAEVAERVARFPARARRRKANGKDAGTARAHAAAAQR